MANKKEQTGFDYTLFTIIIFLVAFGTVMLYSASSYMSHIEYNNSNYYLEKQMRNLVLGAITLVSGMKIDYHYYYKFDWLWYAISVVIVSLVLTPLGKEVNGARRWLDFKVLSFQPVEVAKVAFIIFLSIIICKMGKNIKKFGAMVLIAGFAFFLAVVIFVTNDNLSTAIIVMGIAVVMMYVIYPNSKLFYVCAAIMALFIVALVLYVDNVPLKEGTGFRSERVYAWRDPELYASGKGFQILQGLYAIGSGGIFGKGLGKSIQKLGYIPEAQNDMIFSIICEELGMFGAICVILVYMVMIWRFIVISSNAKDLFGAMLVVGIMAHIAIQVLLNIAVVTNTIPNTGVTLPFISYGGTSIIFLMFEMGIALNVSKQIKIQV